MAEVFINSVYEKLTAPPAKENPEQVRKILNFDIEYQIWPCLGLDFSFNVGLQYVRRKVKKATI